MENNTVENEKPKKKRVKIKKLKEEKKEENKPIHEYVENKTENQIQQTMNKIIFKPMKLYFFADNVFSFLLILPFLPKNYIVTPNNILQINDRYEEFNNNNINNREIIKMVPFFHHSKYDVYKKYLISIDNLGNRPNANLNNFNIQTFKYAVFDYLETNYIKIKSALGIDKNIRDMENVIKIIDNNNNSFRQDKLKKIKRIYDLLIDFTLSLIQE